MNKVRISYFPPTAAKTTITSYNGLSLDKYCIKAITTEELETGSYILDAEFINTDGLYEKLIETAIIKVAMDYGDEVFEISKVDLTTRYITIVARQITISRELALYCADVRPTDLNGVAAVSWLLDKCTGKRKEITLSSDITTSSTAYYIDKSLYEALHDADNCFTTTWGGEVKRRGYTEYINNKVGTDNHFTIREGKNLTGFTSHTDIDSLVTKCRGKGYDGLLGDWQSSSKINNYPDIYTKTIEYSDVKVATEDDSEGFETEALAKAELNRRAAAEFTVNHIDEIKAEYDINFVDLEKTVQYKDYVLVERAYIGDTVRVYVPFIDTDISVRVAVKKYNVLTQRTEEITLTNYAVFQAMSISKIIDKLNEMPDGDSILEQAKNAATAMIKAGLKNSYVVVKPNEILVMNTQDINTATKVWRWNNGGLGYSSTGYNGQYGTAITQDGAIVADFITTGVLNANLIKTGVLKSVNNKTWINMETGTFNFADAFKFDGANFTFDFSKTGGATTEDVENATENMATTEDVATAKSEAIASANSNTTTTVNEAKTELNSNIVTNGNSTLAAARADYQNAKVTINSSGVLVQDGAFMVKNADNEVVIDGSKRVFQLYMYGSGMIIMAVGEAGKTVTIQHNLNYPPSFHGEWRDTATDADFRCVFQDPYTKYNWNVNLNGASNPYQLPAYVCRMYTDENNLYLQMQRPSDSAADTWTMYYRYYIYTSLGL